MDQVKPDQSTVTIEFGRRSRLRTVLQTVSWFILLIYFILGLLMNGSFKPFYQRGFFCTDTSIRYPFKPDTINMSTLFLFALILPGLLVKFCDRNLTRLIEKSHSRRRRKSADGRSPIYEQENLIPTSVGERRRKRRQVTVGSSDQEAAASSGRQLSSSEAGSEITELDVLNKLPLDSVEIQLKETIQPDMLRNRPFGFRLFFFGFCTTVFSTGLGKLTCGRLRPHFMQVCVPDVDCLAEENINRYIESFVCKNIEMNSKSFSYIATSWPSGHASLIFYSMLYMVIYLEKVVPILVDLSSRRLKKYYDPMALYTLYTVMMSLAGYISLTRVSDYHHHPLDVLSGSILGSIVALALTRTIPNKIVIIKNMEENQEVERWFDSVRREAFLSASRGGFNFVEITGLSSKVDCTAMTSLVVNAAKVVPLTANICRRRELGGYVERVGLLKYNSSSEAHKAVSLMRSSVYTKQWNIKLIPEPNVE